MKKICAKHTVITLASLTSIGHLKKNLSKKKLVQLLSGSKSRNRLKLLGGYRSIAIAGK